MPGSNPSQSAPFSSCSQRVGKVTINELRKRGMSGEQLRRIMWGRASISTPVKVPKRGVVSNLS